MRAPSGMRFDFVVVGAGIVGLAVAGEILRREPGARLAVLDKEAGPGRHASGRNSGVLHCGIYYGSDTLKARFCASGARRMLEFARENGIRHEQCGKVILADSDAQVSTLERLLGNARANGIEAERIDTRRLRELEPHAAPARAAIHCPSTAVIDSGAVVARLCEILARRGVAFRYGSRALAPLGPGCLRTGDTRIEYGRLFNCAGAHADRLARAYGLARNHVLVPFKGIYWKLADRARDLVRANIYPVPDASLPFLGVHLTRGISGDVYVGPTAIPALGRENYGVLRGIEPLEALSIGARLAGLYARNEGGFRHLVHVELGKYRKRSFLDAARRLVPELRAADLVPTQKAGIRPQLVDTRTHRLEMDYVLERGPDSVHVLNAISPAFTSAFAFAERIVDAGMTD